MRDAQFTVNVSGVVVPAVVATETVLSVAAALFAITNVAVICEEFTTFRLLTVTRLPDTVTVAPLAKLLPVNVTLTLVPRFPEIGVSDVSVGDCSATTVNGTLLLGGPLVVTVTVGLARVAVVAIEKVVSI